MRVQKSYIDTFTAQVAVPGLFGGFSFHGLKKLKVRDSWIHSTSQRKRNSKRESSRKSLKNQRLFPGTNLVVRPAWTVCDGDIPSLRCVHSCFWFRVFWFLGQASCRGKHTGACWRAASDVVARPPRYLSRPHQPSVRRRCCRLAFVLASCGSLDLRGTQERPGAPRAPLKHLVDLQSNGGCEEGREE